MAQYPSITKAQFLDKLSDILEREPGTISGDEELEDIGWDSVCVLAFIAMADRDFGMDIAGSRVMKAFDVSDLVVLLDNNIVG